MTNRERFHKLMNADSTIDRYPALEWAVWWDKTIDFWEKEGIPKNMTSTELFDYFGLDRNVQFWFPHKSPDCPKEKFHGNGLIMNEEDYERIKPFIYPEDAVLRMKDDILKTLPGFNNGDTIVWYTIEGFFWFPRVLFGIEGHMYAFYDDPKLYHRICNDLLNWHIKVINEFSQFIKADFMTIAEDMSYNHGPMISEGLFNEFIKPYYEKLIPEIKKHGTRVFVDTDGDITRAIPWFINAGVEGILPLERQAGVELEEIRRAWPDLLMIGGFDKMCMLKGKEEIKAEFERLVNTIRCGKYLPAMDHQTPPGTTADNYRYYVKLLKEYGSQVCRYLN